MTEPVDILLIPGFHMVSLANAIAPLSSANWTSGHDLYAWRLISRDGKPVLGANGLTVAVQAELAGISETSTLIVCSGDEAHSYCDRAVFAWLRRMARSGAAIGGLSSGAYILARAGLLGGYRVTIHWDDREALRREFPHLDVRDTLFEIDRDRFTCAGGIATVDMMLTRVALENGPSLASEIAYDLLHFARRDGFEPQESIPGRGTGLPDPRLLAAVRCMERNLEAPLTMPQLCAHAGASRRSLFRLFAMHLATTPMTYYRALRLQHARRIIRHEAASVLGAAYAAGFVSPSHFSRLYKRWYGKTPMAERTEARLPSSRDAVPPQRTRAMAPSSKAQAPLDRR